MCDGGRGVKMFSNEFVAYFGKTTAVTKAFRIHSLLIVYFTSGVNRSVVSGKH
jgi:hypothetical protein